MNKNIPVHGSNLIIPENKFTATNMNKYTKKCIEDKYTNDIKNINRKIQEAAKEGKFSIQIRGNEDDFKLISTYYLERSFKIKFKFGYLVILWD
ncbi:hypothetical protein NQ043_00160 [Staphylococcus hyicus]|uniref:hypothetical protein n=1 Tax=Staphylococcus hyicus TaxID=1284 RepID=UPI00211BD924|nr:hypothetical protein [Staphylococcus hyicus]MCQ9299559.1 hypothetical protein [Staphylococcus hyicus]